MTGITVLGPVAVGDDGALSPRDRVVLSVLVARRGREVPAEVLAEALWGEDLPASWHKVVQGCVARLRRRLGHEAIVTGGGGYRLAVPAEDVDAARFERLVDRARELLVLGHADQAAFTADQALALWRGMPLADLADWAPGRGEAERLGELRLRAEELRLDALLAAGRHSEVLPEAGLRVREEPLREHRWALLARAQYQDGRQAEALATLRRARETLTEELGLDPGAELAGLEHAVLTQDPALAVAVPGMPASACPWPGLAAYDVDDADAFFGREAELAQCLERLDRSGFLAVVGPSGSGKSSLVRAGLAARLRRDGRRVRVITPDPRPLDALAAATSDPHRGLVLVVDQCEEIFGVSVPPAVRQAFLTSVAEHAWSGTTDVVLTLRADRMGELAAFPDMARLVEEGLYLLKGIGPDGLRAAIERPARRAGLLLEEGLVDLLVRDVEGEPGSLPLLAHALRQTWERREGSTLTVGGYRASGGIRGAVARSAEQVYERASQEQRHALRELMLRMVQPGPGGDPVRTSVPRAVLTDERHVAVVEQLVRARLVTAAEDRLEIAHEALARAWPRLQAWLADDVQGERIRHHLAAAASAWDGMGRPESELYRGARLAAAREWRDAGTHSLSQVEQDFLATSEAAHRSRLARAEDEARRQRRLNHRLRLLAVGAVVLALVAATFGAVARAQWRDARTANELAVVEAARARSHELAAAALADLPADPARAKSLAVLAGEVTDPGPQTAGALHAAHAADPVVARVSLHRRTAWTRLWTALRPDGERVAMAGESAVEPSLALEVRDAVSGELVWEWLPQRRPGHESAYVAGAAYSPDGSVLATGVVWHPTFEERLAPSHEDAPPPPDGLLGIHLRDARTHEPLGVIDVGPCGGWPLGVTADRVLVRALVPSTDPASVPVTDHEVLAGCRWWEGGWANYVVDRQTGDRTLLAVTDPSLLQWSVGAALSGDGSVAAAWHQSSSDSTLGDREGHESTVLVDTTSGKELGRIDHAFPVDLDAAGERVLLRDRDVEDSNVRSANTWRVVRVDDLSTLATFAGHEGRPTYAAFSADGTSVLSTGLDNVLLEWDASSGTLLRRVVGAGSGHPDPAGTSRTVIPRPLTGGAVVVDTSPRGEGWAVPPCDGLGAPDQLRVVDGSVVAGRGCDGRPGTLEVFDPLTGGVRQMPGAVRNEAFGVSADGERVVSQGGDEPGPLQVRQLGSEEVVLTLEASSSASAVRWSPDDRWVAALDGATGRVGVWDATTGDQAWSAVLGGDQGFSAAWDLLFSTDSARLLVSTDDARLIAVGTETGEELGAAALPSGGNHISPGLVGHRGDGAVAVVSPLRNNATSTSLLLLDPTTLETRQTFSSVVDGSVRSAAVSPDGTRVAMATSEGFVGVWDLATGAAVDRADLGLGSLEGVQWTADGDLLVLSAEGAIVRVTSDPAQLTSLVRGTLTRGLTLSECAAHAIDPCPDLGTLRGAAPTVPDELRGSYTLTWTVEELREAGAAAVADAYGAGPGPEAQQTLDDFAAAMAGTYRLTFSEHGYSVTSPSGQEWCTGAVTRRANDPDRLLLGADRGAGCVDFHYAETGWRLEGDELVLPPETFRGSQLDALLWTGRPLERAG
ncbi:BTAD domain-containing putative transcriptional regulator [Ornithinimicrobium pekingense]|uniref:OmpR/PhoB-type domain-containing protein n=1 Tax=Ornithinimicrobium pekingense TaxID=384677 RepID=A0ABQ2F3B0_9MICO|nr:BTAD domain-containing putative transcriptional regulator [Ornithinimicrobium pekingense]GGK57161.1 hypothetical protein GCM10011509_01950 [Ornithinimicrobium pekingense]